MIIIFHNFFRKKLEKLSKKDQVKVGNNLRIFTQDQNISILNNHALHGKYLGCRSINISGDLRAIYRMQNNNIAFFIDIDNHANLYK